jgi:hypothetical protein
LRTLIREDGDNDEMAQKDLTLAGSQPIEVGLATSALGVGAPTMGMAAPANAVAASTPTLRRTCSTAASRYMKIGRLHCQIRCRSR